MSGGGRGMERPGRSGPACPLRRTRTARVAAAALGLLGAVLAAGGAAAAVDELRIEELRQDIRELQRQTGEQARRIERLERELARGAPRAGEAAGPAAAAPEPPSRAWLEAARWDRLRSGMTAQQVIAILGPPSSMRAGAPAERTLFYALQIGDSGFLSGSVRLMDDRVTRVERPVLK